MNRHESQIPVHLHGCDGPPSEIIKCQNSDGRIAEERLGKAHFKGSSEVADAELPGRVVEAMDRQLAAARAEPKRITSLRVNSHPAGSSSHTAQGKALRRGRSGCHALYAACSPNEAAMAIALSMAPDFNAWRMLLPPNAGAGASSAES